MKIATRFDDVLAEHGSLLHGLAGQAVERAYVVWYEPWDDMHAASPVVLRIGRRNVELWSIYVAEFGVTCDTLDLARPPFSWVGRPDAASRWVEDRPAPLRRARGQIVRRVRLLATDDLCAGIEFVFDGWALTVLNQEDDMLVTDEPLDSTLRWVDVRDAQGA
ncbi:hypothetical protein [Polyangium sp. 15x6]|uniref:hypothetical protein n=1 Tax=Polyangium sp. 15x6 TaxID=3042687 RepID=UPI00249ADD45|nr:hypothetical protein [Polyangium sp. 15x6]MDI3290928.1 hypothetical protein [Polyangium sp. 15x6]